MLQEGDAVPVGRQLSDRSTSPLTVIPSWMTSLTLHAILLFLVATRLQSCGDGSMHQADGAFREVGIYVKDVAEQREDLPSPDESFKTPADADLASSPVSEFDSPVVPESPPLDLLTPTEDRPNLGGGAIPAAIVSTNVLNLPSPSGAVFQPSRASGLGPGETTFFNVRDKGTRFVYVLDASGSMGNYHKIRVAKTELKASLQALESTQKFQVVFYNESPSVLKLRGKSDADLFWATDINRTQARQFIDSIRENAGTNHMLALQAALRLKPDVMFFLTDADEPALRRGQVRQITEMNRNSCRIHCIEFGEGGELKGDNFLKQLARENGGHYRYRDVTRFANR